VQAVITSGNPSSADTARWVGVLSRVREAKQQEAINGWFLTQLPSATADEIRTSYIAAIETTNPKGAGTRLIELYPKWPAGVKKRAVQALLSRSEWALMLFTQLDAGKFSKADVSVDQARAAVALNDKQLTALVEKHFGKLSATAGEKQARIASLNTMLGREKPGDPAKGKAIFTKSCGACHQLFGEGGKVGPDLTTADRKNRGSLLASVVDPSGYIGVRHAGGEHPRRPHPDGRDVRLDAAGVHAVHLRERQGRDADAHPQGCG
jgi:mono/diheme cytochrome c family protein